MGSPATRKISKQIRILLCLEYYLHLKFYEKFHENNCLYDPD